MGRVASQSLMDTKLKGMQKYIKSQGHRAELTQDSVIIEVSNKVPMLEHFVEIKICPSNGTLSTRGYHNLEYTSSEILKGVDEKWYYDINELNCGTNSYKFNDIFKFNGNQINSYLSAMLTPLLNIAKGRLKAEEKISELVEYCKQLEKDYSIVGMLRKYVDKEN